MSGCRNCLFLFVTTSSAGISFFSVTFTGSIFCCFPTVPVMTKCRCFFRIVITAKFTDFFFRSWIGTATHFYHMWLVGMSMVRIVAVIYGCIWITNVSGLPRAAICIAADTSQLGTVFKRIISYRCQTCRDFYGFQRITSAKSLISNSGQTLWKLYTCQAGTALEYTASDARYACRNSYACQTAAVPECLNFYWGYRSRNGYTCQTGTIAKCHTIYGCYAFWNCHTCQIGAAGKCTGTNAGHSFWDNHTCYLSVASKCIICYASSSGNYQFPVIWQGIGNSYVFSIWKNQGFVCCCRFLILPFCSCFHARRIWEWILGWLFLHLIHLRSLNLFLNLILIVQTLILHFVKNCFCYFLRRKISSTYCQCCSVCTCDCQQQCCSQCQSSVSHTLYLAILFFVLSNTLQRQRFFH